MIGLTDKKDRIPGNFKSSYSVIDIDEINIAQLGEMADRYTWSELLANAKPFFARYLLQQSDKIVYFDCTTLLFNSVVFVENSLNMHNIIIVPQLLHAGVHPDEKQILNTGIFHSGFLALKKSVETLKFLDWWSDNTAHKGQTDLCKGFNADQLWLEHVPNFYEGVLIEKSEGLNIGAWNLPERTIDKANNTVNGHQLISINFKGMKYWPEYKSKIKQNAVQETQPYYGIPDPKDKKTGKQIARNIRKINSFIDKLVDMI